MKLLLIRFSFILFLLSSVSLSVYSQDFKILTTELNKTKQDTSRAAALIKLGLYFKGQRFRNSKNLDTALRYFNSAITLSQAIGSTDFLHRTLFEKALTYIEEENFKAADSLFNQITDFYHKTRNYSKEAEYWTLYGNNLSYDDKRTLATRTKCYDKAYVLYKQGTDRLKIADALGKIADADLNEGRFDKAEKELLSVIQQYKAIKFPRIYYGYYLLAEVYSRKDQLQKELLSRIECMNSCDADVHRSDYDACFFHIALASSYRENNKDSIALLHYIKAAELAFKIKSQKYYYDAVDGAIASSIAIKHYKTALAYLNNTPAKFPTQTIEEQSMYVARKMQLYNFLNRNAEAERFVPTFRKVFNELYNTLNYNPSFYLVDQFVKNYDGLPQHYIQTKKWDIVSKELKFLQTLPLKRLSAPSRIIVWVYKYKIDSARGSFDTALKEFQYMRQMKDSLSNDAAVKQINELEASYNSIKKDKTIQTLNGNAQIQRDKLEKANRQKDITLAGVLISIVFAVVIYIAYRAKQRSNVRLQAKQEEIDSQNHELSDLLSEKEKLLNDKDDLLKQQEDLLTEKEWLLREVHHRVKNNLQIVMSLLYTQSAYLQNTDAIEAIHDSRNRVQAISIIHQKLYNKSNVATIVMADYISDLSRYLNTCYDCNRRKIKFREELDVVNLDIAQAVPMGLILNEAITNSIKYAFDKDGGEISIRARLLSPDLITLIVADNGRGLPLNFNLAETSSLGMEMMKALSKQLGGSFEIKSDEGVVVTIQFKIENTSAGIPGIMT